MIHRTLFEPSPQEAKSRFLMVVYDKYQYLHQAASHFMGGMQSNLIVFGIN